MQKGPMGSSVRQCIIGLPNALKSSTGESPFNLCYGAEVVMPTELKYTTMRLDIIVDPNHIEA